MVARRYFTVVLLASVWLLCCLPCTINAQSTRGMGVISTAPVSSTYAQSTGYVFGPDSTNTRSLVAVGNNLFAVSYDNPSNINTPIFQTIESDDQIIGAFYDNVNGSIFVCTRIYRRIYWLGALNGQGNPTNPAGYSIRNRGQTNYRYWNACALDKDQKGIWVAAETEIGYYKTVYQSGSGGDYTGSDVYGSANALRALVIINGNAIFGGASGNVFITSVTNINVYSNSITRYTRGVGQIQTMDVSPSLNKIYIGGDLGVLTEIDASTFAFTRISFIDDATLFSIQVDDTYNALFLNAISRSTPITSRIIRINLNDPNFDTFGVFTFPLGVTVNRGELDPRSNKYQMMFINSAGDTVSTVRTASCTDYTCSTCSTDTNYCGYCSTSRACVTPTSCSSQNFYTSTYVCPALTSISPSSGSTDGGTVVTVTGQFTDPAGNTLNTGFECQWGTSARVGATVVNGATLRCNSPSASVGDTTFRIYYSGSLWAPNSLTFSYYSCSALTSANPCTSCFTSDECGLCIPTMQCASQRGCPSGFSNSCPVIGNISPASASIVGNNNFTITIDKNINANYQCLYSSSSTTIVSTPTPATLIRSNTLTCRPPTVTNTNWVAARGTNRELNVDLVLKVSTSSAILASKSKAIYLFDCDTYGQDCSGCTNSLTQGECAFCFDTQNCTYSSVQCSKTGTCPSISSVSPSRIYTGAVQAGQKMTIAGKFGYLNGQTFYCAFNAVGDDIGTTTTLGAYSNPTAINCTVHTSLGVGTNTVSLWLQNSITSAITRLVPNFSFNVYTCTGTACDVCLDSTKPECVFCSSSATCQHSSAACSNTKLTASASCPSISDLSPTSVSKTGNATIVITGAFNPTPLGGPVSCIWSASSTVSTPATYVAPNEVHCTAPAVSVAASGTVTLANNGNAWTNSLPFLWYDCAQITGDCSKCITDVTPKCTWCTSGCDEVCADPELKTDVCPSLTSVTPNYGYVLGGETVSVSGGPFFSRANFSYECRFGDKVSPAVVQSISVLSCATPTSLLTQTVNVTIWMNGIIYAPFSSVQFTYYECQTFAQTSCNSFCMAQPHCGWCVASSSCTSASRCGAQDDLFLTQCLTVTSEPNHMSIFGNSNVTLTFTPRLPDFLLLNSSIVANLTGIDNPPSSDTPVDAPVAAKRSLLQIASDSLLTCTIGGLSQVPAYVTGLNTVTCALPASGLASRVSLGVLYKGSSLLTPIDFTYVDCETTSNCDDCSRKQYCGWCLQENSCSTLKRCIGDWANGGCPSLISITPDSASASGGASLTLVGEYFINHPSIKILMGKDAAEYEFINSTTMTVIVVPGTADESADIEMMFDDKKYATNTLSFTWVSPFSVPGLAAGMSIAGALMIGGGVFYYLFNRYQKRRQGLFVQVKEPDYEKVAYQNEMVQHFRVTSKDDYVELEDILMNKDRTFLRILVAITAATEYDAVAKALVYLSHHKGIGSDLIQFFASDEVRKSTSENTIFRQNSMASKMFKFYSQIVGTRFLFFTLARVINELNTVAANAQKEKEKLEKLGADTTASLLTIEMEVDPNKLKDSNVDKDQNVYQLALACQKLFTAIAAADENVPAEFRQIFTRIQSSITEQYGDSEAIYKALGGFLFLRFVCPAITAPHYYGLLKEPPNSVAQRQLVLIAKVLQNLANLANTKKEAFMESMLDFIERNKPKMIQYYKSLLNPEAKANPRMANNLSVPATVRENSLAYLHTHIYRNQQKVKAALMELPDQARARQLATLVDRIIEKYGEPPKRLKDKGGPVRSAPAEPIERPDPAAPKNVTINNPVAQVGEKQASPRAENNTNEANNNRPVANRPSQGQYGTARRNQFSTLREPFFDIADAEPVGNLLEDNVFTDTMTITEANMFDNPFDINFEPMANELDFEVFDNPLLESNTVVDN